MKKTIFFYLLISLFLISCSSNQTELQNTIDKQQQQIKSLNFLNKNLINKNDSLDIKLNLSNKINDSLKLKADSLKDSLAALIIWSGNKIEQQSKAFDSIMIRVNTLVKMDSILIDSLSNNQIKGFTNLLILTNNVLVNKIEYFDSIITAAKYKYILPYKN